MRTLMTAALLAGTLLTVNGGISQAAPSKVSVKLAPPTSVSMMSIRHASGSAALKYMAHGVDVTLSTAKLPDLMTLHESVYVLWLVNGTQRVNAGALKVHNGMGGLHKMVMSTKFNKLVVTAEKMANDKHAMGIKILQGNVMHH